jgi:hypothetical protein
MRRILTVLLVVTCVLALVAPAAHAGGHEAARVVIGLATFAIFAPLIIVGEVLALAVPPYRSPAVVVTPPPVYSAPPPIYSAPPAYARQTYAAPARTQPTVIPYPHGRYELRGDGIATAYQWVWIQYPHGRYELRGDGIATAYQWVWIPNPTTPPLPPDAPPAAPAASQ